MPQRIWLIGGTSESAAIAQAFHAAQLPYVVTMTTASAQRLYPANCDHPNSAQNTPKSQAELQTLWVGKLSPGAIASFLETYQVVGIVDASHPFATAISELAIATAKAHDLPYLRYERPGVTAPESGDPPSLSVSEDPPSPPLKRGEAAIARVNSVADLVAGDRLRGERVLLTLGYRWLPEFAPLQSHCQLYSRILPSQVALKTALDSGFTPDRLIALRPPISPALEQALWQQWRITTVVTKASGQPGGEGVKRELAQRLNVRLILINRPAVTYPNCTDELNTAIAFAQQVLR